MARFSLNLLLFTLLLAVSILALPIPVSLTASRAATSPDQALGVEDPGVKSPEGGAAGAASPAVPQSGDVASSPSQDQLDLTETMARSLKQAQNQDVKPNMPVIGMRGFKTPDLRGYWRAEATSAPQDQSQEVPRSADGQDNSESDDQEHQDDERTTEKRVNADAPSAEGEGRAQYSRDPEDIVKGFGHMQYHAKRGREHADAYALGN